MNLFDTRGKVAVSVLIFGFLVAAAILVSYFFASDSLQHARFAMAQSTATTTVTVLNTPPNWTVNATEAPQSSTSSPTNAGSPVSWQAIGTDPNSDNYYLLICKTSGLPTANNSAPPVCNGGAGNQWAVSASTVSGASSTATYTTLAGDAQINAWFGWICDGNAGGAQCNAVYQQGSGNAGSPFVVNHRPNFTVYSNNSPAIPGATVTWTGVASDTDNFAGATDTIQLFVCKAPDFTGTACGAGGFYCSSTAALANPTCSNAIAIPTQDQGYSSYGYVIDQHQFAASGGPEGSNATETVSAVAPTITSSSINLLNVGGIAAPLALTNPGGLTAGFQVTFTASDNNSCLSVSGGQEVATATIDVFRTGLGLGNCSSSGNYNANNCYPGAVSPAVWNDVCAQNGGSCSGSSSLTSAWTCTFPLWYVADPTDGTSTTSQYWNQAWAAAVQATNYLGMASPVTQSASTNTVQSFLASQLNTPSISFGALPPGSSTPTTAAATTLSELGNIGLNETLYGTSMCSTYPGCPVSATSTIPVNSIVYATSVVPYGSGVALAANPGNLLAIQIPKSTATTTPSIGSTYWGLSIPGTIQLSGAYTGQNTFIAVRSSPSSW
jgi:hypothetical protein